MKTYKKHLIEKIIRQTLTKMICHLLVRRRKISRCKPARKKAEQRRKRKYRRRKMMIRGPCLLD